jgi:cell division protein FtsL
VARGGAMTQLTALLLVALLASCLVLVKTSYESRRLFAALDRAQAEANTLEADYQRLAAERSAQSTSHRVDRVARERLRMRSATPELTVYVVDPDPGQVGAAGSASHDAPGASLAAPAVVPVVASPRVPVVGGAR